MTSASNTRRLLAACVLVALSACRSRSPAPRGSSPTPSASPTTSASVSASATPSAGAVVAAIRSSGDLDLFRIVGHAAVPLRTLAGPAGGKALDVSISGGPAPTVCGIWELATTNALKCFDAASGDGYTVATGPSGPPVAVAVSSSGRSIAWIARRSGPTPDDLYRGTLSGGAVTGLAKTPALDPGEEPDEAPIQVSALAWQGEDTVLVSYAYDDDLNGSIVRVRPGSSRGWTHGAAVPTSDRRPIIGGAVSPTRGGTALAVQRGATGDRSDSYAVVLDLASGRATSVVATPDRGRGIQSVSGGEAGVLYRTEGDGGDVRTYWRAPGERHGRLVTGVPADAYVVVAQA